MADCGFGPFEGAVVKAVKADSFKGTRKVIDKMMADIEVQSGNKAYWFKVDESGAIAVGSKIERARLDVVLPAGTYECTAYFHNLDPESGAIIGTAGAIITITIQHYF